MAFGAGACAAHDVELASRSCWIDPAIQLRPWTPIRLTIFAVILFIFAFPRSWVGAAALPRSCSESASRRSIASLIIGVIMGITASRAPTPGA